MADMTPNEARERLANTAEYGIPTLTERRALATLANMRVEHDHGVVDWEKVDGIYEVYHRVRLVGDWHNAQ